MSGRSSSGGALLPCLLVGQRWHGASKLFDERHERWRYESRYVRKSSFEGDGARGVFAEPPQDEVTQRQLVCRRTLADVQFLATE